MLVGTPHKISRLNGGVLLLLAVLPLIFSAHPARSQENPETSDAIAVLYHGASDVTSKEAARRETRRASRLMFKSLKNKFGSRMRGQSETLSPHLLRLLKDSSPKTAQEKLNGILLRFPAEYALEPIAKLLKTSPYLKKRKISVELAVAFTKPKPSEPKMSVPRPRTAPAPDFRSACKLDEKDLPSDFNRDGIVDTADRDILIKNYGLRNPSPCDGDVTQDGKVDDLDLLLLGTQWTGVGGLDFDKDGVFDHEDCSPQDLKVWRSLAYRDSDGDDIPNSPSLDKSPCFGASVPKGFTLRLSELDNCPRHFNPDQIDTDNNSLGDACDNEESDDSAAVRNTRVKKRGFRNPQVERPLNTNPNGLKGERPEESQ